MSRLRRSFQSDRFFFVTCNVFGERQGTRVARAPRGGTAAFLTEDDFSSLTAAIRTARESLGFLLTAWVFLPDHWHAIIFPAHPLTISKVMKVIKAHATYEINVRRGTSGQLWQDRFYEHVLRTVEDYHDWLTYIHFNPVKSGLVTKPDDWKWSSVHEYEPGRNPPAFDAPALRVDRVQLPADLKARLY